MTKNSFDKLAAAGETNYELSLKVQKVSQLYPQLED
jgi:hypothetical protein